MNDTINLWWKSRRSFKQLYTRMHKGLQYMSTTRKNIYLTW